MKKKGKSKKQQAAVVETDNRFSLLLFLIFITVGAFGVYTVNASAWLIPSIFIPLLFGLVWEFYRLSTSWKSMVSTILTSFAFSLLAFLPGRSEKQYDLDFHTYLWPYSFCIFLSLAIIALHEKEVTAQLAEGVTLLQSIAIIYWSIDSGVIYNPNYFIRSFVAVIILFSLFSVLNAIIAYPLSRRLRLCLSIWSSIVMIVFAIDNFIQMFIHAPTDSGSDLVKAFHVTLQYFLLGVSCVYTVQNVRLILNFLPQKNEFNYTQRIAKLKMQHIGRYSTEQAKTAYCFFCILFAGTAFTINHYSDFLPRNTAVWLVFVTFPLMLHAHETKGKLYPKASTLEKCD